MGVVAFPGCEFTIAEHVEAIFTTLDHDAAAGSFDAIGDRVAEIIEREAHHVPQENGGLVVLNHPRRYYDDPDEDWTRYVPLFETYTRPDGLVGMEVFNKEAPNNEDVRLWDLLLTEFSPDSQWESRLSTARAFREGRTLFHEREPWDSDAEDPAVPPTVESMSIASQGDEITIEASHYDSLEWISRGDVVSTDRTISLDPDYLPYVRAHLRNDDGAETSTQPFVLSGQ